MKPVPGFSPPLTQPSIVSFYYQFITGGVRKMLEEPGNQAAERWRRRTVAVSSCDGNWLKRAAGPGLVVAGLLLATIVINPFREMLFQNDGFAYARSVEHLIATGKYRLDSWSAANMPVQIYLATGLSKLIGYSLSLLRCMTLALLARAR